MSVSNKIVGFHDRHLCVRGTTVALYDYAVANEEISKNKSVIFYNGKHGDNDEEVISKFKNRFTIIPYINFSEVDEHISKLGVSYLYCIKHGMEDEEISKIVPTLIHAVFENLFKPHGNFAFVSRELALKHNQDWLPHIISPLPYKNGSEFRRRFNIPLSAYVYGRYGGFDTFSIEYVKELIREEIWKYPEVYFLFCNTEKFIIHPRVIFSDKIVGDNIKGAFIDSCDAMIHARKDGETFGLSVAEFSLANKVVLTCKATERNDNEHIHFLSSVKNGTGEIDRVKIFNNKDELRQLLWNYPHPPISSPSPYSDFTAENVMKTFWKVMLKEK